MLPTAVPRWETGGCAAVQQAIIAARCGQGDVVRNDAGELAACPELWITDICGAATAAARAEPAVLDGDFLAAHRGHDRSVVAARRKHPVCNVWVSIETHQLLALLVPQLQANSGQTFADGEGGLVSELRDGLATFLQPVVWDPGIEMVNVVIADVG